MLVSMASALAAAGVFENFWHWTVEYARAYAGILTLSQGLGYLLETAKALWAAAPGLWSLAALGFALLWFEPTLRQWRFFLVLLAAFSTVGVCPGFYFRNHYFLLVVPAASLLCGAAWCAWTRSAGRFLGFATRKAGIKNAPLVEWTKKPGFAIAAVGTFGGLFLLAVGQSLAISADIFFRLTPEQVCRRIYNANPFPESVEIARYLAAHSSPEARIAVLGSEPQIYFYSHRRAATGYIYTYPLMEAQAFATEMQRDMIREIEQAAPEYLIYVSAPSSWMQRTDSDLTIFGWSQHYCQEHMELDVLVETFPDFHSEFHRGMADRIVQPRTDHWIAIYKRKPSRGPITIHLKNSALLLPR